MSLQPDEAEIRCRVKRRWSARLRFLVHIFLTLPVVIIIGRIGSDIAAVVLLIVWTMSLLVDSVWLIFLELSKNASFAGYGYEKLKRGESRLSMGAIGDEYKLSDLFEVKFTMLQPDEAEIRHRVKRRWSARLRFLVHVLLTLPLMTILGGTEWIAMQDHNFVLFNAASDLFTIFITSVLLHA